MLYSIKTTLRNFLINLGIKKYELPFYTKDMYDFANFDIGDYTYGSPKILFKNQGAQLHIGKFCSLAEDVTIFLGGNHRIDWVTTYPFNEVRDFKSYASGIVGHPSTKGDVWIGNDVWIGRGAVILSGLKISNGAVVGAYSVVTKDVGPYEVWAGNPAKLVKKRFSEDRIAELQKIQWWNWELDKIKKNIHNLCSNGLNI